MYRILSFNQHTASCMHLDHRNQGVIEAVNVRTRSTRGFNVLQAVYTLNAECHIIYSIPDGENVINKVLDLRYQNTNIILKPNKIFVIFPYLGIS